MPKPRPRAGKHETLQSYLDLLVAFRRLSAKERGSILFLCDREKALAVNEALARALAPEGKSE